MNHFDYLNSINQSKQDIMVDDIAEKEYNSFMVNRGLSYFLDSILFANEMNRCHQLDNKLQYHFLINMIRKRKRFSKWAKATKQSDIDAVKEYYGYSNEKARQAMTLLSPDQITIIKNKVSKGGRRR